MVKSSLFHILGQVNETFVGGCAVGLSFSIVASAIYFHKFDLK